MTEYLALLFLVGGFIVIFKLAKLLPMAQEVFSLANRSLQVMASGEMTDEEKEKEMQRSAVRLFALSFFLALGGAAAVFLPLGLIWLAGYAGLLSFELVMDYALSMEFLVGTTLAIIVAVWLWKKRTPQNV